MKLLLDENLSDQLVALIADLFPESAHVKAHGLITTDDSVIWKFAADHGYTIVSKDADFHQRSLLYGHPPKFVYLRVGNGPTSRITALLRSSFAKLCAFDADPATSILILS